MTNVVTKNDLEQIDFTELADALASDLAADPENDESLTCWLYEPLDEDGFRTTPRLHIVHSNINERGGVTVVGSGCDGSTHWTDAAYPIDVLRRYLNDDMRP